ncbi:MAG TPA: PEGA domain-containing protein [Thiotrichales bacterium]|nr:PEGA domain-containing protein [Thiotrichales bacterium]
MSVYILTSIQQLFSVEVRAQESRQGDGASSANLALSLKQQLSADAFDEQQNYLSTAATAVYVSLNKIDQRNRFKASVQLTSDTQDFNFIAGSSSSGLGYALALFDAWWTIQLGKPGYTQTLYATGEIATNGEIIGIEYVAEKINHLLVKLDNQSPGSFVICLPKANENDIDAELRQRIEQQGGQLLIADRLQDLLQQLLGDVYDGDPLGRWEAFKGLKSFEYEDSIRFFGRDKDIERLNNDLQNNQGVLIVSGQSGSGKSSLIKAGLIPYLEKHHPSLSWHSTTPKEIDGSLLDYVLKQLNRHLAEDQQYAAIALDELAEDIRQGKANPDQLAAFFPHPDTLLLLHIDQFEEYYTSAQRQANRIELDRVHELTKQLPQLKVIVSIRNEYIAILLESGTIKSPVISNVTGNLTLESWQEIIYEQAAFSGYTFEQQPQDLASVIIDQAIKTANALPMVEFLLEQIAEKAKDSETPNLLKHEDYQSLGGLEGAIATRADACSADNSQQLHIFFSLFVATNNEGIAYARPVIYPAAYIEQNTALDQLIQSLRNANILLATTDNQTNNYLKLSHDSLFTHWQRLKDWLTEQQSYLAWRNEIDRSFKQWQQNKNDHYLKDKQQRQEGLRYLKAGLIVEPELISYLQKSQSQANNRRISLLALILIPLLAIAGYFYDQNRIKVAYHTAIAEKWSVPEGLHEISEEQMKKRTGSYKLEYQGGVLKRLSYVNAYDVPIEDKTRDGHASWSYQYKGNGSLDSIQLINASQQNVAIQYFTFDEQKQKATMRSQKTMTSSSFLAGNKKADPISTGFLPETKTQVSQQLLQYADNGYLQSISFLDSYGAVTDLMDKFSVILFERNTQGLPQRILFSKSDGKRVANLEGAYIIERAYSSMHELVKEKETYEQERQLIKSYLRDQLGNALSVELSTNSVDYMVKEQRQLNERGLITNQTYDYLGVDHNFKEPILAKIDYEYDAYGRLEKQRNYDQFANPYQIETTIEDFNSKLIGFNSERDDKGRLVSYTPLTTLEEPPTEACYTYKRSYTDNGLLSSVSCSTKSGEIAPIFPTLKLIHSDGDTPFSLTHKYHDYADGGLLNSYRFEDKLRNIKVAYQITLDNNASIIAANLYQEEKPVSLYPLFPHGERAKFDSLGNRIELSYVDENNKPVPIFGSNAFKHLKTFDRFGRLIEEQFLDAKGSPLNLRGLEGMVEQEISRKLIHYKDDYIKQIEYFDMSENKVYYDFKLNRTFPISDLLENKEVIYLDSNPRGAKIYIDDQLIGVTPLKRAPEKSTFKFKLIKKGGYHVYEANYDATSKGKVIDLQLDPDYQNSIEINLQSKEELYRMAALNDPRALNELGRNLLLGNAKMGIEKSLADGFKYISKSAGLNDLTGYLFLGEYYRIYEKNDETALRNYMKACNLGSLDGCYWSGNIFKDYNKIKPALMFYQLASDLGDADSAMNLTYIYQDPSYGVHDINKSLEFANRFWVLEQSPVSARALGDLYDLFGDYETASVWYKKVDELSKDGHYFSPMYLNRLITSKGRSPSLGTYLYHYDTHIRSAKNILAFAVENMAESARSKLEMARSY